jgi:hypothetical protein
MAGSGRGNGAVVRHDECVVRGADEKKRGYHSKRGAEPRGYAFEPNHIPIIG